MPRFYILKVQDRSEARAELVRGVWTLTGNIAGEPVLGVEFRGEDADARCFHAAKRLAFHQEAPVPTIAKTITRAGLQPVTVWRKAV